MNALTAAMLTPASSTAELDRLGDEIAELSVHLDAAIVRLLDLIREFDGRGGWGNGFRSCAHWLSWRVGLDIGAAREKVRVARALGTLPRVDPRRHAGDRGATAGSGALRYRGARRANRAWLATGGSDRGGPRGCGTPQVPRAPSLPRS